MSKELNVIIINDFANVTGGATKVAIDTAVGLSLTDVNVHYFCTTGILDKRLSEAPIRSVTNLDQPEILYAKNKVAALLRGIWNKKANKELKKLLRCFDKHNTVIHVHGWVKSLSASVIACALQQKFPVVITLHDFFIYCPNGGFYNFPQKSICTKKPLSVSCILSNCDSRNYGFKLYRVIRTFVQKAIFSIYKKDVNLIALSQLSANILNPYIKGFKKTYFVGNPIDTFKYPKVNVKNNSTAVFIGRLSSEKGVTYFCEALRALNANNAVIIGDGTNMSELELNYPDVKFVGWKDRNEIRELLMHARYLVFPSVWYETYGLVVQEASSYGIPCIVSDCTAACELINDRKDGLIFRSKDVAQLSHCMDTLYKDDDYVQELGQNAYDKFWTSDHSVKNYAVNLKTVFDEILTDHK